MPGTAVATTSSAPESTEAPGDASHAVVVEVLDERVVGGEGARPEARPELGFLVGERRLTPKHAASPDLPSTSTISTLMPVRAAATASAAVTVVFPTPPLPATITTREVEQKRSRSMPHDATGVLITCRLRRCAAFAAVVLAVVRRVGDACSRGCRSDGDAAAVAGSTWCRSRATSIRPTSRSCVTRSPTPMLAAPRCSCSR